MPRFCCALPTQPIGETARPLKYAVAVSIALLSALPTFVAPPTLAAAIPLRQAETAQPEKYTFVYVSDHPLKSVSVAGTFNNWDRNASPMHADADGKTWRIELPLLEGKHQYKFVLDGKDWITDPTAKSESDGNGNTNSTLLLMPTDYARPASPDDGVLAASALRHETRVPYRNYDRGFLTLSLRLRPDDARSIELVAGDGKRYPMRSVSRDDVYARYAARLPWDRKSDLSYTFEITDGPTAYYYGAMGLSATAAVPFVLKAKEFQPFVVPLWVEKSVLYQIFPDRFDNGDPSNDPPDVQPWNGKPTYGNRFGGDVAGVRRHLGYLADLGVSAVYFNPVFQAPSNHRYDTQDYKKIDPQFGTNDEFSELTRDLKARGIRTVMDFVFNHTATTFAPFADIRKNGEASPYKDWYFIHSYPVRVASPPNYTGWYGFAAMPKLNVLNPATRDYLFGVIDYWEDKTPLAGMRLDVANEVDPRFWRAMRIKVKEHDPDTWIVGEVWGDGSKWLSGDQWDSVMDYPFRDACLRFFAEGKTTPTEFMDRLMSLYGGYAPQVSRNLMNLLSSHDTPRFLTLCHGNADLHRLAATVQFTWAGMPSIYYGEELGMEGGADPDNRRGMRWDLATSSNPMLAYYKRLIAIRKASPALQSGEPEVLLTDDTAGTLAYSRTFGDDAAVVALNRSDISREIILTLPEALRRSGSVTEALTGRVLTVKAGEKSVSLTLPARSAVILVRR